jgi:PilZ domain-containing protein
MVTTGTRAQPRVNKLFFIAYVNREGDSQKTPVSLGRTLNISALGVGMEVFQPLTVDSTMEMEIGLATETLEVTGKVVHITPQGNEAFYVGIQFDEPQEKLAMLVVPNHP